MTLHIFNPETDYALALGKKNYSPPASILEFRKNMALFPASFARKNDAILILDDISDEELTSTDHYHDAIGKNIRIIRLNETAEFISSYPGTTIQPWGWNHTLLRNLVNAGVDKSLLKSEEEVDQIRNLSHRHTSISIQSILSELLPDINVNLAKEFTDLNDAIEFCNSNPGAYFKAPWSSSGRGVINSSGMTLREISAWLKGCIRRQGSVIAEIGRIRTADFATEWKCDNGEAVYLGLSLFKTSSQGRYQGNISDSQNNIWETISNFTSHWNDDVINAQKIAIEKVIAPFYNGPVGIDMFSTIEGDLNPCVEINLRITMGLATLWQYTHDCYDK